MKDPEDLKVRLRYGVFPIGLISLCWLVAGLIIFLTIGDWARTPTFIGVLLVFSGASILLMWLRPYAISTRESVKLVSLISDDIFSQMALEEFKNHIKICKWFIRNSDILRFKSQSSRTRESVLQNKMK